ncbi:U6 snRNA-associated SM protein LSM8, putative [Ichthyophthirius multifiliis]|uniref:U6 snRNA-associated Sm-like protein LSm8 n=1 Tax=Ichthyophthirius multifiliis TaxID=5932 RepID=G0R454_ICHMU|nr:U6 snRNA-associated SM protein LSM8, putative [Ichthyophthirius multifiliis]EGR27754.1 U6 snRNA-associated SM protein LSM8, putative [Ichthyophthirius multifiliis]|eukprot:XP_004025206.1 U6 snRNA-associated SM protein LSM8, putative [Ichthyophthirius multifiliis]
MEEKKNNQMKILNPLEKLLFKKVQIVTSDGRILVGILKGLDQALNSVLSECTERVYSLEQGVQFNKIGLYVLRGDNVCLIGELDEDIEQNIAYENVKCAPLRPITN